MKRLLNTLYVTNPDARLRKKDDAICVAVDGAPSMSVPFHVLESIVLFGHVGCSMALLAACAERGVSVTILDERGRFKARVEGETTETCFCDENSIGWPPTPMLVYGYHVVL